MPRRPANIRQADVTRVIKAARKANLEIARVEVDKDGKIVVIAGKPTDSDIAISTADDELEQWRKRKQSAHSR
jgi:hypothetical protein